MSKQVTIVGVGALGSHLLQFIRNEDATFKVVDFDRVERKNTMSQFHGVKTVGKSKVQSVQQNMKFMFGTKVDAVPHRLVNENINAVLKDADLIIDCLDNFEARNLVKNYAEVEDIPCVHGALAPNGEYGQVMWNENFRIDSEAGPDGATCEDGEHIAFIALVSAYLARSVHEFLVNDRKLGFQINPVGAIRV
jgi:molybdopterin/thiamine biosynthesis adenylyltransferase